VVAELRDPTVKDVADLHDLQAYEVLACIPHLSRLDETPSR